MGTNKNTLRFYWQQIRFHKPSFFTALILIPVSALLLDTLLPFFLSQAVGSLSEKDSAAMTRSLVIAGVIGLCGATFNFIGFRTLIHHEAHIRTRLYNFTFRSLLRKDYLFFTNEKIGALTSRFIDFIRAHIGIQDLLIIRTLGFCLSLVIGLTIVSFTSPILTVILLALIVGIILEIKLFTNIRRPYRHERKALVGTIHGEVADSLTNSLLVKTFASEEREIENLEKQTKRLERIFIKDIGIFAFDGSLRNLIMASTQVACISICAYMVLHDQMSLAIAIFAIAYLQRVASQIFMLGDIVNGYDENLLQAAPMSDILTHQDTVLNDESAHELVIREPRLELQNIEYRYEADTEPVITDLSLTIPAGQKIGLVGHSGAGKTTITNLLLRFADVTNGAILIDGHDIRAITQASLRKHIAYVPQEPMLFHRTLRENIAYGRPGATEAKIRQAAKQANALEFIERLPHGFDTLVGERGVKLSGGQRQRIAIARAILKDAHILVLDEATSALDSESEKLIQDSLVQLMEGRTSIVIAHRLSTIAKLDRIIVLDGGKIAEDGSHTELLKKKGIYASLWSHQSGGFIEE